MIIDAQDTQNKPLLRSRKEQTMNSQASQAHGPVFHHVNLKTRRLQEMIDWYGTVIGTKPTFQFPGAPG